jgi:hypothetical protein
MIEQALDFRDESDGLFGLLDSLGDSDWECRHNSSNGRPTTSWRTFTWATSRPIFR